MSESEPESWTEELIVGEFKYDHATKNTRVYTRFLPDGRKDSTYLQKADLHGDAPVKITVVVRW